MSYTVHTSFLAEEEVSGKRLGRHVEHDERSRAFELDTSGLSIAPVRHERAIPVLDQGNLGSCTGNAAVGTLGTHPFFATLPAGHLTLDEPGAVTVYSMGTHLDTIPGTYLPDDTGSTGNAVAKALRNLGLVAGYQHTFSTSAALKALSVTPVMIGVNWYEGFDHPDGQGAVKVGGQVRGGHEFVLDEITADGKVGATNSWSTSWGVNGRFYFSFDDLDRLLGEQGDVTVLVPLSQPAPTPTPTPTPVPTPTPDDVDKAFYQNVLKPFLDGSASWVKSRNF